MRLYRDNNMTPLMAEFHASANYSSQVAVYTMLGTIDSLSVCWPGLLHEFRHQGYIHEGHGGTEGRSGCYRFLQSVLQNTLLHLSHPCLGTPVESSGVELYSLTTSHFFLFWQRWFPWVYVRKPIFVARVRGIRRPRTTTSPTASSSHLGRLGRG